MTLCCMANSPSKAMLMRSAWPTGPSAAESYGFGNHEIANKTYGIEKRSEEDEVGNKPIAEGNNSSRERSSLGFSGRQFDPDLTYRVWQHGVLLLRSLPRRRNNWWNTSVH